MCFELRCLCFVGVCVACCVFGCGYWCVVICVAGFGLVVWFTVLVCDLGYGHAVV